MNPQELEVDGEPEFCESNVRVNQNPNRNLVDLGTAPGEPGEDLVSRTTLRLSFFPIVIVGGVSVGSSVLLAILLVEPGIPQRAVDH